MFLIFYQLEMWIKQTKMVDIYRMTETTNFQGISPLEKWETPVILHCVI